jgi:hypothetical protein
MTSLPSEIEGLASLGWRLYPASRYSRAGCIRGGTDAATSDVAQLGAWSREFPGCNWRAVLEGSGAWGLDCDALGPDHSADGIAALAQMVNSNGPLPPGPTIRSGGGGLVFFFAHHGEPIHGRTGWPKPGLDPRRGRLSVTVPPSFHTRSRAPYRWLVAPWDVPPPPAPDWLLQAVAPPPEPKPRSVPNIATAGYALRRLKAAADAIQRAPKGTSNDTLNRWAFAVARFVGAGLLGEIEAVEALYAAARARKIPHEEARSTIRSAFKGGYAKPMRSGVPHDGRS